MEAVNYIARKASSLNMPWVINMTYVLGYGSPNLHDGSHELELYIDSLITDTDTALGYGRVFIASAGNEGDKLRHSSFHGPGEININVSTDNSNSIVDKLWIYILYNKTENQNTWVKIIPPISSTNQYDPVYLDCASNSRYFKAFKSDRDPQTTDGLIRIFHDWFDSHYTRDIIDSHPNDNVVVIQMGDGVFPYDSDTLHLREGTWKIQMGGTNLGRWDAYIYVKDTIATKQFVDNGTNAKYTISPPGNAKEIITVGSFNSSRLYWKNYHGYNAPVPYPISDTNQISDFSSWGPFRDGTVKPELYAPGATIMSCRSGNVTDPSANGHSNNTNYHDSTGYYNVASGTSMSASHVAGAAALSLEWDPSLTANEIEDIFVNAGDPGGVSPVRIDINVYSAIDETPQGDTREGDSPNTEGSVPELFSLQNNYPNPFNPRTKIEFDVFHNNHEGLSDIISIKVYNVLGQEVKTLLKDRLPSGSYSIEWDGTDNSGNPVASGIYLYSCEYKGNVQSKKMALIK